MKFSALNVDFNGVRFDPKVQCMQYCSVLYWTISVTEIIHLSLYVRIARQPSKH